MNTNDYTSYHLVWHGDIVWLNRAESGNTGKLLWWSLKVACKSIVLPKEYTQDEAIKIAEAFDVAEEQLAVRDSLQNGSNKIK